MDEIDEFLKPENVADAPMVLLFIGSHGKQGGYRIYFLVSNKRLNDNNTM